MYLCFGILQQRCHYYFHFFCQQYLPDLLFLVKPIFFLFHQYTFLLRKHFTPQNLKLCLDLKLFLSIQLFRFVCVLFCRMYKNQMQKNGSLFITVFCNRNLRRDRKPTYIREQIFLNSYMLFILHSSSFHICGIEGWHTQVTLSCVIRLLNSKLLDSRSGKVDSPSGHCTLVYYFDFIVYHLFFSGLRGLDQLTYSPLQSSFFPQEDIHVLAFCTLLH